MALAVWAGRLDVLGVTAGMSELQEKFEISSQSTGEHVLSVLKMKG